MHLEVSIQKTTPYQTETAFKLKKNNLLAMLVIHSNSLMKTQVAIHPTTTTTTFH